MMGTDCYSDVSLHCHDVFPGTILPTGWRKQVILLVPSLVRAGDYDALLSNEASKVRIHMQKYCKARRLNDRCNLTRAFEDVLQQIIISSRVGKASVWSSFLRPRLLMWFLSWRKIFWSLERKSSTWEKSCLWLASRLRTFYFSPSGFPSVFVTLTFRWVTCFWREMT
jgi:hypothetical protein